MRDFKSVLSWRGYHAIKKNGITGKSRIDSIQVTRIEYGHLQGRCCKVSCIVKEHVDNRVTKVNAASFETDTVESDSE